MSMTPQASSAYAAAAVPIRTGRGSEYAIFAKVTHRLRGIDETDKTVFPALAAAVTDNQRLWGALSEDLMSDDNALPIALRAQLIGLAEFVRRHSMRVLSGKASIEPLIDINTSIMRGLRGEVEARA
ncbi:flagellar biosynthesis regulator FlaF [Amaricoccus sp.]|uniref:flagellar biosynthesis regulator FlaF n=1 Tax=Amaricoccus sp. TaxID=1872485 RepID=UPI002613B16D|nr:flagellar biosynthesis regulator FlaF [uncultured Amaricoccus sp.]